MRKTEIERTITFTFDCNDFLKMKEEFESVLNIMDNRNEYIAKQLEELDNWFDKYFDTEYLPCKKCLFLPKEEKTIFYHPVLEESLIYL